MKINAEFNQRVVVHSEALDWVDSPMPGVARRPLDRVGNEIARATTIVRYAPGSQFSPHIHTGGEEFLVLDGVFQDEHGDFTTGAYIRNPPQSGHTPGSAAGCIIFVKLWQFDLEDRTHIRLNANFMRPVQHRDLPGASVTPLYVDQYEEVSIHTWDADTQITLNNTKGIEILVLEGEVIEGGDTLVKHSWLRLPIGHTFIGQTGPCGAKVWIKQDHLTHVDAQIERVMSR